MSTSTPLLSLTKPDTTDQALIADLNANFDVLDNAVTLAGAQTLTNKTLTSPTFTTPTIASFVNATHIHQSNAGGGVLDAAAITGSITGTGNIVKATSPTIVTPTIASFANATHDHSNAAGGGATLSSPTITTPTIASFANATHNHSNAAGGGATLTSPTITTPTIADLTNMTHNHSNNAGGGASLSSPTIVTPTIASFANATHNHSNAAGGGATLTSPTVVTPTIASFTNAQHDHSNAAGGGLVSVSAPSGTVLTLPKINDTSSNNTYNFAVNELVADRTITLPLLGANDTFVFEAHSQTLSNKTLTTPTIGSFTNATHDHSNAAGGGATLSSPTITTPTIASFANATHNHSNAAGGGTSLSGVTLAGTVSGTPTWGSSQAITLSTAAQPNITSLGTIASLVTSGNVTIGAAKVLLGASSDANLTVGLVINQGANDDSIVTLKSSDVAHGVTGVAETDTYGRLIKQGATTGGLNVTGISSSTVGVQIQGVYTTDDTTKSASGSGGIMLQAVKKSGTTTGASGANANLVVILDGLGGTRAIVDVEGDIHVDGSATLTTYDDEDDAALLETLSLEMDATRANDFRFHLARDLAAHRKALIAGGVLSEGGFLSYKGIVGLLIDGIRQVTHAHRELAAWVTPLRPVLEAR